MRFFGRKVIEKTTVTYQYGKTSVMSAGGFFNLKATPEGGLLERGA